MAPGSSSKSINSPKKSWNLKDVLTPKERDIFWHPAMTGPPPINYTPGLIPVLKARLTESHSRGDIRKAVLCYDETVYIQRQIWDATWGCGYRNFLMACAALMVQSSEPLYFPLIDAPISPGIRNLQQWIEIAWDAGFDAEGKKQLKKLKGTQKWIGTSDLWVAFSSRGIPSELVDFDTTKANGVQPLIDWVVRYFTPKAKSYNAPRSAFDALKSSNSIVSTDLMPLILQHSGHSRLVVGYEIDKKGNINILTFDCARPVPKDLRDYALSKLSVSDVPNEVKGLKRQAMDSLAGGSSSKRSRSGSYVDLSGEDDEIEIVAERNIKPPPPGDQTDDEIVITGFTSPSPKKKLGSIFSQTPRPDEKRNEWKGDMNHFRITAKALGKSKQYQILYFPMTSPLTDPQRFSRRIPISTKIS